MCAQIHTSKFHFRFAFVFPFTLCFPFRALAKAQIQSALCQVLSGLFFEFLARTRHQHWTYLHPLLFPPSHVLYYAILAFTSRSPWRDFCVCLVSVRVPKMSFGRANKLNSIFCRRAKLLKTRLLPSCVATLITPTHTHTHIATDHMCVPPGRIIWFTWIRYMPLTQPKTCSYV